MSIIASDHASDTGISPDDPAPMSEQDFANWGTSVVAFIKPAIVADGTEGWSIHAANGAPLGFALSRDSAFAALRQHDLQPASVH